MSARLAAEGAEGGMARRREHRTKAASGGFPPQRSRGMHTVRESWLLFVAALLLALIVVVTVSGGPMTRR